MLSNTAWRCPGHEAVVGLPELNFHALSCQPQVFCSATPRQLPFSQFDDVIAGHLIISTNKVVGGTHRVILSYAEHPRIFVLHVQLGWFLFRIRIYSFARKDGILFPERERCWNDQRHTVWFSPTLNRSDCSPVYLPLPGALSSCPVGGYAWLTVIFPSISSPPGHIHVPRCPQTAFQDPPSSLLFPTPPCQLSLDFLWIHAFFLNTFLVPFHLLLPVLSGIFKRNEASFFLRVESLGSPLS